MHLIIKVCIQASVLKQSCFHIVSLLLIIFFTCESSTLPQSFSKVGIPIDTQRAAVKVSERQRQVESQTEIDTKTDPRMEG